MLVSTVVGIDAGRLGDHPSVGMVVGETVDVVVEGVETGSGERPGLAPAGAESLAPDPGLGDLVGRPEHQRSDRRTQALRQADGGGVGDRREFAQRNTGADVRVPDPGAVEVHPDAAAVGQVAQSGQAVARLDSAAGEVVGVLDRDRRRRDQERSEVGGDQGLECIEVDVAVADRSRSASSGR